MAFSWTVVSTVTEWKSFGFTVSPATPAWIITDSNHSQPEMRFRHLVSEVGWEGSWCRKNSSRQVLPIRVLVPTLDHGLVRASKRMFQVMQSGNQAGRHGWGALVWAKKLAEFLFQGWPIDEVGQSVQFMSWVEDVQKAGVEQVGLAGRVLGFWLHLESKFARN